MLLCSPHNPGGRVWHEEELRKLCKICMEHDITIISDEIHSDLIRREIKHVPIEKMVPEYKNRIITATAPSKTFNMAGMMLSNVIIHDKELKEKWNAYTWGQLGIWFPPVLSIVAAQAAYYEGEDWLEQVLDYLDGNLYFIQSFLAEHLPKAVYSIPEGSYLAWIDLSAYGYGSEELMIMLLKDAKIFIEEGKTFGEEGEGFFRINAACTRDNLKECLTRLARVLNKS